MSFDVGLQSHLILYSFSCVCVFAVLFHVADPSWPQFTWVYIQISLMYKFVMVLGDFIWIHLHLVCHFANTLCRGFNFRGCWRYVECTFYIYSPFTWLVFLFPLFVIPSAHLTLSECVCDVVSSCTFFLLCSLIWNFHKNTCLSNLDWQTIFRGDASIGANRALPDCQQHIKHLKQ